MAAVSDVNNVFSAAYYGEMAARLVREAADPEGESLLAAESATFRAPCVELADVVAIAVAAYGLAEAEAMGSNRNAMASLICGALARLAVETARFGGVSLSRFADPHDATRITQRATEARA
jgi:hypothetical protein